MRPGFRLPIWLLIGLACAALLAGDFAPRHAATRQILSAAEEARARGHMDEAAALTREALALSPWRADLWERAGMDEARAGDLAAAGEALREALRRGGLSPAGMAALGDVLLREGDADGALEIWRSVLEKGAPSGDVYRQVAAAERARGALEAALQTAERWKAFDGGSAEASYQEGILLLALQREGAMTTLLAAAAADTEYAARVETLRRGYGQAMTAEDPARRLLLTGRALGGAGEWDLAGRLFEEATEAAPEYAEAWAYLGEARQRSGQDGTAELERALEIDPQSLATRGFTAVRLRRQGKYEEAMEYLVKIIAQNPDECTWWMEAGATSAEAGDLMKALEYYQQSTRVEPRTAAAWQGLAGFSINYEVEIQEIGLPAARQALELAPGDPGALNLMGWAFLKLGDLASAERFLQRALEADGRFAAAHLHLGQVYLQKEEHEDARRHLEMAARWDGEGAAGRVAQRLLERYFPSG